MSSGLGMPQVPIGGARECYWSEGLRLECQNELAATMTGPRISRRQWMDECWDLYKPIWYRVCDLQ